MIRRFLFAVVLVSLTASAFAQSAVPTPDDFLGYKLGDRFTPYSRILDYFNELTKHSNLITMQQFGETYEHRPLMLAVITSAKNRASLETYRQNVVALGDPEATPEAKAADIASSTPAVVWLAFGVHGNESSSSEAAMQVASTLLRDPDSQKILDNCIVLVDPLQNPDGRERYVQWFIRTRGADADPNRDAFEHNEGWPSGRFNHYLIDMNRDWAWTSQAETKARVVLYRQWNPQVFVDFHEMGWESSYFFPPDAKPINANLPKDVEKWLEVFGKANAAVFTQKGWPFFVGETFDLFYPAYGDSWPAMHGAVGMTYEVAGSGRGGTAIRRDDDETYTLADRIARHYTSGMATLRTAAEHRQELLRYTYDSMRSQTEAGKNTFLVVPGSPNFDSMIDMLQRQGIRIGMLTSPLTIHAQRIDADTADNHVFPAGTAVVSTHQPLGGLVQTLLEKSPTFSKGFLEEQRAKTQADESDDFYDLTSWSLPLAMNVETYLLSAPFAGSAKPYAKASASPFKAGSYGYLVDAGENGLYRLEGKLLANDIHFGVSEVDLTAGDHVYPRGAMLILKGNNRAGLDATLERLSRDAGITPVPLDSGWAGGNVAFGSERIHNIRDPKIALIGGQGANATSYGLLWHTLDIDTPIPHTNLALESLGRIDLEKYSVLIFPDGDYGSRLGKSGIEHVKEWIHGGGTVVAIKEAGAFLREKDVEVSKIKAWAPPKKKDDEPATDEHYNDYRVPGSAFRTTMNERSYLTFGVPRPPAVLIEGTSAYLPVSHKVDNIVTLDAKNPLLAGVAWPESLDRLKGAAYLVREPYGEGQVITFTDEPNYRLFWRGTLPLFLNAVIYSPSFGH